MFAKRGQSAVEVSVFIFLIGVFVIGYIILLPAEDRAALLDDDFGTDDGDTEDIAGTLLSEAVGDVSSSKSSSKVSELEPMRLYSTTESNTQNLASSLTVSRNILQNNYKNIYFDVDDISNLESLRVLFLITESKGDLFIELNGNPVYEGELTSSELPVELSTSYLQESDNILKMYVDSPGIWLFSSHYYLLQDVELLLDYTVADTSSTRTFSVDDADDVSSVGLNYFITCNSNEDGILTINLNNREVFSDQIFCDYLNERELGLDEDYLQNTNTLKFEVTEGDYNIEEIEVSVSSRSTEYPSYSFDVESDLYEDILSGDKEVYLKLSFGDDTTDKEATILINEYDFKINTEDGSYEKKITSMVDNGANTVTIEADTSFEIDNLKVYYS
ncbi:hypothetical protein HN681_03190 [archaeon]|jgi:hypothetical protein|nr:hypothetical protein [archaeon]MBT3730870.1 hypothetical protein [archaeon]MBT4669891.1 hypothetical protein [archaeon]MBT5030043.1 hypothetical protein [archaeon]MBT5288144.1 hypothetical protein [archaeon]